MNDVCTITWQPLPAPPDRYLLVRISETDWKDENKLRYAAEIAYTPDGINFFMDDGKPYWTEVNAWAFMPYDS